MINCEWHAEGRAAVVREGIVGAGFDSPSQPKAGIKPGPLTVYQLWGVIMGTKNEPGVYDCYEKAESNEPMFILLGRDRHAPELVRRWAWLREMEGEEADKVREARQTAVKMGWFREQRELEKLRARPTKDEVLAAAKELSILWNKNGRVVDSQKFFDAIEKLHTMVCQHANVDPIKGFTTDP